MSSLMRSPTESGLLASAERPVGWRRSSASRSSRRSGSKPPVRPRAPPIGLWVAPPRRIGKALENRDLQWLVSPAPPCRPYSPAIAERCAFTSVSAKRASGYRGPHARGRSIRSALCPARIQAPATARTRSAPRAGGTPQPKEMIRRWSLVRKRERTACPARKILRSCPVEDPDQRIDRRVEGVSTSFTPRARRTCARPPL